MLVSLLPVPPFLYFILLLYYFWQQQQLLRPSLLRPEVETLLLFLNSQGL